MVDFDWKSTRGETILDAFRLGEGVKKPDSLKSKDFSIILCKESIFSLCLVDTNAIAVIMAEVIALEIKGCITGSIVGGNTSEVSSWN